MSISAVALFGSRARGDADPTSDVDLLLITSESRTRHTSMGNVSLYLYPWEHLLRQAANGDLFVCHLVRESRPLHDPGKQLAELDRNFRFKDSYTEEIKQASDLGWYIVRSHTELPGPIATRRLAWCVRTILIARAAEQGRAIFAASELADFSGLDDARRLIAQRKDGKLKSQSIRAFERFLAHHGATEPLPVSEVGAYRALFRRSDNQVALQTLRSLASDYSGL